MLMSSWECKQDREACKARMTTEQFSAPWKNNARSPRAKWDDPPSPRENIHPQWRIIHHPMREQCSTRKRDGPSPPRRDDWSLLLAWGHQIPERKLYVKWSKKLLLEQPKRLWLDMSSKPQEVDLNIQYRVRPRPITPQYSPRRTRLPTQDGSK